MLAPVVLAVRVRILLREECPRSCTGGIQIPGVAAPLLSGAIPGPACGTSRKGDKIRVGIVVLPTAVRRVVAIAVTPIVQTLLPAPIIDRVGDLIGEGRVCRVSRIRAEGHLPAVVKGVIVAIGIEGIGHVDEDLVAVAEAIAITVGDVWIGAVFIDLLEVCEPVAIAVAVVRVGAVRLLLQVGQAIHVDIIAAGAVEHGEISREKQEFPGVGEVVRL